MGTRSGRPRISCLVTDEEGTFDVEPPERFNRISAYHPDYAPAAVTRAEAEAAKRWEIVLGPGHSLNGTLTVDGEPGDVAALAVGQVVEVAAAGERAVSIRVLHEVEGEVTEIDAAASRLVVLGQSVALTDTTWTDLEAGPPYFRNRPLGAHAERRVRIVETRIASNAREVARPVLSLESAVDELPPPGRQRAAEFVVAGADHDDP